jgi:3-phosphoshikimate 1-carboxyvinyltransferase
MSDVVLEPIDRPIHADFTPPGSKSLTNRALVVAALADGVCDLRNVLFADDTHVMIDSLQKLGFRVIVDREARSIRVHGTGGRVPNQQAELFVGNSGTTIRFLTALVSLGRGTYSLDGVARMRERPIGPLADMLRGLGATVEHLMTDGFPPVRVTADGLRGGTISFGAESSSQYLSAVLMSAPYADDEVKVELAPHQTSWPYVSMTMRLMDQFGVICELERDPQTGEPLRIIVPPGKYAPTQYDVEPDASNASYFLALAAVHAGSTVRVNGVGTDSIQGDAKFEQVLSNMGCVVKRDRHWIEVRSAGTLRGIDVDMSTMPDTAQTLAVVALFADGPTTMRGLHTLRVKETDRVAALQAELAKLGARVDVSNDDSMTIHPPERLNPASIDTYDDHRMAMSFAIAATRSPGVVIRDAQCVNKTYPGFFDDLRGLIGAAGR